MNKIRPFKCVFLAFILTILAFSLVVKADNSDKFYKPSFMDRTTVITNKDSFMPNTNNYPFNSSTTVRSIGFGSLYGTSHGLTIYKGEIPYYLKGKLDYRYYNGTEINGRPRPWSVEKDNDAVLTVDSVNSDDPSTDPHLWAMTQKSNDIMNFLGSILLLIIGFFNKIFSSLVELSILIKNMDFSDILLVFDDGTGSFVKTIGAIFLIDTTDPNNPKISPFLMFSIFMFVSGMVAMSFKCIKGERSIRLVINEFLILLAAFVIAGVFFMPNNPTRLGHVGIDFMTSISNSLVTSSVGNSGEVFIYNTGNASMDSAQTQMGLVSKMYMDSLIEAQFGYKVSDLDLQNESGTSDFGDISLVELALQKTFGYGGINNMRVVTGSSSNGNGNSYTSSGRQVTNSINNLGYYWWAANTNVAIYDGTPNTRIVYNEYYPKDITLDSNDRILYIVDFLSNLRKMTNETKIKNKIDKIMRNLVNPKYSVANANVAMVTVEKAALLYGLFFVTIFCLKGQLVIVLGSFVLVVVPALLLFKGTRDVARRMVWTYLLAFLRFLIGSALFNTLIVIVLLLSSSGIGGMVLSIIICAIMGKFGPKILDEINEYISRNTGNKELGFMQRHYRRRHGKNMSNLWGVAGTAIARKANRIKKDHDMNKAMDRLLLDRQNRRISEEWDEFMNRVNGNGENPNNNVDNIDNEEPVDEKVDESATEGMEEPENGATTETLDEEKEEEKEERKVDNDLDSDIKKRIQMVNRLRDGNMIRIGDNGEIFDFDGNDMGMSLEDLYEYGEGDLDMLMSRTTLGQEMLNGGMSTEEFLQSFVDPEAKQKLNSITEKLNHKNEQIEKYNEQILYKIKLKIQKDRGENEDSYEIPLKNGPIGPGDGNLALEGNVEKVIPAGEVLLINGPLNNGNIGPTPKVEKIIVDEKGTQNEEREEQTNVSEVVIETDQSHESNPRKMNSGIRLNKQSQQVVNIHSSEIIDAEYIDVKLNDYEDD